jgi:hypothetical protein
MSDFSLFYVPSSVQEVEKLCRFAKDVFGYQLSITWVYALHMSLHTICLSL